MLVIPVFLVLQPGRYKSQSVIGHLTGSFEMNTSLFQARGDQYLKLLL